MQGRLSAKYITLLIEMVNRSSDIDFLRNIHAQKMPFEEVFGGHCEVNFLTTHSQLLDNALSVS